MHAERAARTLLLPRLARAGQVGVGAGVCRCGAVAGSSRVRISNGSAHPSRPRRRALFSLPDLSKLAGAAGSGNSDIHGVQTYHETKEFRYSADELYRIVSDVDSYASFLPNCLDSRVLGPADPPHPTLTPRTVRLSADEYESKALLPRLGKAVRADLTVGFKAFKESYTSRVEMVPSRYVTATADTTSNPLFKHLYTEWSFHPTTSASSIPLSLFNAGSTRSPSPSPSATASPAAKTQPQRTRLEFTLEYAFRNPLYGAVASKAFDIMASRMMHAFEERAVKLYGRR